uniref:Phosphoprotein n=1 Tax=Mantoniella tinhauana virus 1 TaxID=3111543 RepID=A0AB38ZMH6_9VIRU
MDEEIVLDRGNTTVMKLDADEQALMDEIEISVPKPMRPRPTPRPRPPPPQQYQEEMDAFVNPHKQTAPRPPPPPAQEESEVDEDPMYYDDDGGGEEQQEEQPSKGYTSVDEEKSDLLNKLARLEKKGFNVNKRLNAYSSVEELRSEVKRITYSIDVDQSIRFSRRMLVACVTGLEFLNKRYNPFEIHLDGWSESIMENVDDYDGVFEELYVKYRSKVNVAPEVKLIMMLGGSAMMFHLTNSMFKSVMPNMNDVMKQNPDLVKNMMAAVQNTTRSPQEPPTTGGDGQYEMQGPGVDISSLMGGIMMPPPPPMNTNMAQPSEVDDDDMSDIVSISGESTGGEVKEVNVSGTTKTKKTRRKKKTEINL